MTNAAAPAVTEETRASLLSRIAAMKRLWELATRDLTLQQVNRFERPGVLPIAFTIVHAITGQDRSATALFGGPHIWDAHASRVGLAGVMPKRGTPMADAEKVRIADVDAWRAYQREVFERTERAIREAPLARLSEPFPMPADAFKGGFLALLTGSLDRVRVVDVIEAWIYQHGIRHVGELEHARALVGLGGVA